MMTLKSIAAAWMLIIIAQGQVVGSHQELTPLECLKDALASEHQFPGSNPIFYDQINKILIGRGRY